MFGNSAISRELFDKIREILPEGDTVLEFGMGEGTKELLKHYNVVSIEHNPKYAKLLTGKYKHWLFATELVGGWYDLDAVVAALDCAYDLILIDGPPAELRANLPISLFAHELGTVIFDDVNREIDRDVMLRFCRKNLYDYEIIKGRQKHFAVCIKK